MKTNELPMLPKGNFWGSCSRDDNQDWYREIHAVRVSDRQWDKGWQDTYCGASASPGLFRGKCNRPSKTICPKCLDKAQEQIDSPQKEYLARLEDRFAKVEDKIRECEAYIENVQEQVSVRKEFIRKSSMVLRDLQAEIDHIKERQ